MINEAATNSTYSLHSLLLADSRTFRSWDRCLSWLSRVRIVRSLVSSCSVHLCHQSVSPQPLSIHLVHSVIITNVSIVVFDLFCFFTTSNNYDKTAQLPGETCTIDRLLTEGVISMKWQNIYRRSHQHTHKKETWLTESLEAEVCTGAYVDNRPVHAGSEHEHARDGNCANNDKHDQRCLVILFQQFSNQVLT